MAGIKITQFFQVLDNEYTTLKITPSKNVHNGSSFRVLTLLEDIRKDFKDIVKVEKKKFKKFPLLKKVIIEQQNDISYIIDIIKNDVSMFLIFPSQYKTIFMEKVRSVYKTVKLEEVERIKTLETENTYFLKYKNEDGLSLKVDKRENRPINNILNVLEVLQEKDHIRILYNFKALSTFEKSSFTMRYKDTIEKIKNNECVIKNKNCSEYRKQMILKFIFKFFKEIDNIFSFLSGTKKKENKNDKTNMADMLFMQLNNTFKLSDSSKNKNSTELVKTNIVVQSISEDKTKEKQNAISTIRAFNALNEDNELIPMKVKKNECTVDPYRIKDNYNNVMSIEESGQFIQVPSQEICRQYGINYIETTQTKVPKDLTDGIACIGIAKYREEQVKAFLSTDKNLSKLSLAIVGPTRAGKSTLIANLVKDYIKAGQCVIMLDYIGNCELSKQIINQIPKEKTLVINTTDKNNLEALDYSELNPISTDIDDIYDAAKNKATKVVELINIMNKSTDDLTALMQSLFKSGLEIAFSLNKTINDAITILQDPSYREKIFKSIPENLKQKMKSNIVNLNQLNKKEKNKVSNNDYMISGIISRLNTLKSNSILEKMLLTDPKENINLIDEMQKNQLIAIQIPEGSYFNTDSEKDIICSFWLTRLVQAMHKRRQIYSVTPNKMTTVNLIIDEVYTVEQCQQTLEKYLSRFAKFYVKIIITAHYINQLKMKEELKSANTSYMFLGGSEIQNYIEMKQTFKLLGYNEEDFANIPRFHSLNVIKCEEGLKGFITELPKKIILES